MTAARSSTMMIAGSSSSGQTAVGRNQSGAATSAGNPANYILSFVQTFKSCPGIYY